MTETRAAVLGASGFAGAELLRRLFAHPNVRVVRVGAADHIGEPVSRVHFHLEGQTQLLFEELTPEAAVRDVDVVLMGLPHQASVEVVRAVGSSSVKIIDMSGAFRLGSAERYQAVYGEPHPDPSLLEGFVYALPELRREAIAQARRVASPGCFATAIELGLLPLAKAGLLRGAIRTVAATGSSGSGVTPTLTTHHPTRAQNLRCYRPLSHPQAAEIEELLHSAGADAATSLHFIPLSAPLTRGIFATSFVELERPIRQDEVTQLYRDFCRDNLFVRVPEGRLPEVVAVAGSNYAEIGVTVRGTECIAFSALDNLIKGGAGQAVQNLNLMLGLPESTGLTDPGSFP